MIRRDKYVVGDVVRFDPQFSSSYALWFDGEYTITAVENLEGKVRDLAGVGHTQWLQFQEPFDDGFAKVPTGTWSGAYFLPIERESQ